MKAIGQGQEGVKWATESERCLVVYIDTRSPTETNKSAKGDLTINPLVQLLSHCNQILEMACQQLA
jgi:hypothetical protein